MIESGNVGSYDFMNMTALVIVRMTRLALLRLVLVLEVVHF